MKIQCDFCDKDEASVFCIADEAALCAACDHRVHHANKLASKHQRFNLIHPSPKHAPLCDVCLERRAFLFCQQDRAILCRECDLPIHTANEHTKKHNRFLLAGVKLSTTSTVYSSPNISNSVSVSDPSSSQNKSVSASASPSTVLNPPVVAKNSPSVIATNTATKKEAGNLLVDEGFGLTSSSISEYLIETLPGWHVEEFLDPSSASFGLFKNDDGMLPFVDADIERNLGSFLPENIGIWVPQAQPTQYSTPLIDKQTGLKAIKETTNNVKTSSRIRLRDDAFIVPQVIPPSTSSKRSRPLW